MNKNIRCFCLIILSILLLLSITACKKQKEEPFKPADAFALWDKVDETMNASDSMEVNSNARMVFYVGGYEFVNTTNSYIFASKQTHYSETTVNSICEELSKEQKTTQIEAYYDGKMYIAANDGTYTQKLCSEMTHEGYDAVESGALTEEVDIKDCTGAKFSEREGGGWELHFSGYTQKAITNMLGATSISGEMLGAPITDMSVDLITDTSFRVEKMTVNFAFDLKEGEAVPVFSIVSEYSGYGTAVFDPSRLNTEEYTQVDDVRVLDTLSDRLLERQDAVSGKFTLDMKTTYVLQGQTTVSQESDAVTYGRKNGAYFYDITATIDGQNMTLRYQNNEQVVTIGEQTNTAMQSESEAKAFIDSLIDTAKYTGKFVTDIKKQSEGVFVLTCAELNLAEYNTLMVGNGVELTSGNQECIVTFAQNKLVEIDSKITLNGQHAGEAMSMILESKVTFDDNEAVI